MELGASLTKSTPTKYTVVAWRAFHASFSMEGLLFISVLESKVPNIQIRILGGLSEF